MPKLLSASQTLFLAAGVLVAGCTGTIGSDGASSRGGGGGDGGGTTQDGGSPGTKKKDAGVDAETGDAAAPFQPASAAAAVTKVKTVLTGLPPTPAEIAAVTTNPAAIRTLVSAWMGTPQYQQKMLEFFEVAFQQNQSQVADFASQQPDQAQFAAYTYESLMLQNYHEMFARTALELIAEGHPFTDTFTTTRFMVTPAIALSLAMLDGEHVNDNITLDRDENFARFPNLNVTFEGDGPIASNLISDAGSPNFMHFYSSSVSAGASNPCLTSPQTFTPFKAYDVDFDDMLFKMLLGLGFQSSEPGINHDPFTDAGVVYADGGDLPPGTCDTFIDTSTVAVNDFSSWRMVNIRKPAANEAPTNYWDFDTLRSGTELLLNIERVGFFSTPSFLASWNTNASNQDRVTMNQTLIVALNQAFDGNDQTQPKSIAAVDESHLLAGCITCHRTLDPMRQFFRHDYTIAFHELIDASAEHQPDAGAGDPSIMPQFAWGGVAEQGSSIADLARLLTQQPSVPGGWAQKLCQWGSSATCDTNDPEFQRIVKAFTESNFDWNTLVLELFSSPIMTYLSETVTADTVGQTVPIARQGHLCALLSNRLGIPDICGLSASTRVPNYLSTASTIAQSYPSDQFSRGQVSPSVFVLANDPNLFTRTGVENMCASIASAVVDGPTNSKYSSKDPQAAINDFVANLMGLSGDRATPMLELLSDHYAEANGEKTDAGAVTPTIALRSTFTLACISPYVIGLGQ
jgi:hypothetical protein